MKNKNVIITVLILVVVIVGVGLLTQNPTERTEVKIGVIIPMTGGSSFIGEDMKEGMLLADKESDNLSLIFEDSQSTIKDAVSAFNKLNELDGVKAFIQADIGSDALIPLADKAKKSLFLTVSSTSGLPSKSKYAFRYFTNADTDAPVIAKYGSEDLKLKEFAVLYINDQFGIDYKDIFSREVQKYGSKVVVSESYNYTDFDFRTQITKLNQYDFDSIYLIGLAHQLVPMINQIREMGINEQILSMGTIAIRDSIDKLGQNGEGVYVTAFCTDGVPDSFVSKFMNEFDRYPGFYAQLGYDMVKIISEAVKKGSSTEKIREGLLSIENFESNGGVVNVDNNGEAVIPMCIKRIENGKIFNLETGNYSDF